METSGSSSSSEREPLAGLVERVTFHNADNGFCVLRIKARGHRDLVTVLGAAPSIAAGEYIQASGTWENHREHGLQFRATFLRVTAPTSAEGMEKYLGSGLIRGIGPTFAQRLVSAFSEMVFEVIEHAPQRLLEVEGIGPKRARRITASWADQKVIREIMAFLQGHGVSTSRAVRIFKTYGADAIPLVSENPYRLAHDIMGIGFKSGRSHRRAARDLEDGDGQGKSRDCLHTGGGDGEWTLWPAEDELLVQAEKLLEIPSATLAEALQAELATGEVVADLIDTHRCIFLAYLWRAERLIAHRLQTLIHERPPWPVIDAERAIGWVEKKFGVTLAASQRAAVTLALANKLLVVTGGPGVGKTTLVNSILKILCAKSVTVALCAPTGRAAKRLAESTGLEAKTILRLFRPKQRLRPRPLGGAAARPASLRVQCAVIAGPPEPVRRAGSGRGRPRCR